MIDGKSHFHLSFEQKLTKIILWFGNLVMGKYNPLGFSMDFVQA